MDLPELDYLPAMPAAIRRAAGLHGDRDYVVMPDRTMSFAEADEASQRLAKELLARGIGKGTRVGIHLTYGFEWVVAFFAITRIGAVCLPLSTAYRPAEVRKVAVNGDIDTLIVPERLIGQPHLPFLEEAFPSLASAGTGPHRLPEAPFLRTILVAGDCDRPWAESINAGVGGGSALADTIDDSFLEAIEAQVTPADWLMVVHTSGTTGEPKGVVHTHGTFVRHIENLSSWMGYDETSTQFSGLPWFWIGGVVLSVGHGLARGFKLLCLERFENEAALELILEHKPQVVGMWGQLGQRFAAWIESTGTDVSSVPFFANAAEPGTKHLSLGQTETMGPHTGHGPEGDRILPEHLHGSFGLRVPHIEHAILDPDTGEELPPGEEGEVAIRGYSLSAGLYKKERHEAFDDDGWLHTGDRGYFEEDLLFFTGRMTEMIKTLGSNVAPREVELVLEERPDIGLAVVIGVPDEERDEIVAAVLVPVPGKTIAVDAALAHAADQLSGYKVPRHTIIVESDDLPSLGSGKPDKVALLQMLVESRQPA